MNADTFLITTRRLVLTPISASDASDLLDLFRDPDVRRYLLDDMLVDEGWVEAEIDASEERFGGGSLGLWSVRVGDDPALIGFAGLRPFFDPPQLQLLYGFAPGSWGRGFATEAGEAVCDIAFDVRGFDTIDAAIDVPNVRSGAVLERLGFNVVRTTDEGADGTTFYRLNREDRLESQPASDPS